MEINKKTLKVVAVFLLIPFAVKPSSADSTKKKLTTTLEISASLLLKGNPTSNYTVMISHDGNITDSIYVKTTKAVFMELEQDGVYTIIFSKKGYDDKMVLVDTHLGVKPKKSDDFTFDFDLEIDPKHSTLKKDFSDLPVAWVRFNKKSREFEISQRYKAEAHRDAALAAEGN